MQVVRTLQKAWRDLGSSRTKVRASGSDQGLRTLWLILLSPAVNQARATCHGITSGMIDPNTQLQTLTASDAHNAVASLVQMYMGIIADAARHKQMLLTQVMALTEENKKLKAELEKAISSSV